MSDETLFEEKTQALVPQNPTEMDLLALALSNNSAIDVIERIAALREKAVLRQDEIEFNEALNRVQSGINRIAPDMSNPQTHSRYASYAALDRVIRPIYTREKLNLSFNTEDPPISEHVRVVCYVSLGSHTRKYQVDIPADGKGAKGGDVMTKTHATGSAMQYGMRYLLKFVFNIAVGYDDDGNAAGSALPEDVLVDRLTGIEGCNTIDELLTVYKAAYKEAAAANDQNSMRALIAAKDKRKKELANAQ